MGDDIHLWHVPLDRPPAEVEALAAILSADELARAARFRDPRWGRRFVVGRAALRQVLGRWLDRAPPAVHFAYRAAGKPELADPHPPGAYFNVTHSQGLAIIAVGRERPLGVDLERVRPEFAVDAIAARFFSAREQEALRGLPSAERPAAFFRCWTRKEAFIKALGAGLSFPLDEFDVSLTPGSAALLALRGDAAAAARWSLRELAAPPGHVAALAVEGPIGRVIVEEAIAS